MLLLIGFTAVAIIFYNLYRCGRYYDALEMLYRSPWPERRVWASWRSDDGCYLG